MTSRVKPFILNLDAKVVHRVLYEGKKRFSLEQCQIDDIARRNNAAFIPQSYRMCQHCFSDEARAAREVQS